MTGGGSAIASLPRNQYSPRSSRNCGTCRSWKRRCDRQRPSCGQCIRQRDNCPGYRDEWELVFRDQTKQTELRHKEKRITLNTASSRNPPAPPSRPPHQSAKEMGVNYFLRNFVHGGSASSRGCLNYIPSTYCADVEHPMLMASMAAVGLMALAKSTSHYELTGPAQSEYLEAVRMVNAAIAMPKQSMADATLMAVISLGVFEEVSDYKSWLTHVQGAAALVVARGKGQFSSPTALRLFNQIRTDLITACVNEETPIPAEIIALQAEACAHADTAASFWQIGVLGIRCAELLTKFRAQSENSNAMCELLQEATVLRRGFESLHQRLLVEEPYTTVQDLSGNPNHIYHGHVGVYKDFWAIRLWNNWRNLLMIVYRIQCYLLNEMIKFGPAPVIAEQMRSTLQQTMQLLSKLGDDILATLPQAMEQLGSEGNGTSSLCSVSGGYLLAGRLSVVGQSEATEDETRRWIVRRLWEISRQARIPTVLKIIEDIEKVEREAAAHH